MAPDENWQYQILEDIAVRAPLPTILSRLAQMLEGLLPGSRASILVLQGERLRVAAGPSLPPAYNDAIDNLLIGPEVGSCGSAAYSGLPVLVADVEQDPRWRDFAPLALSFGLRACWSVPILSQGLVLGTFAVYRDEPSLPDVAYLEWLQRAQHLACLALESDRMLHELQGSEARFRTLVDNSQDSMFLHDHRGVIRDVNKRACESLQYRPEDLIGSHPLLFDTELTEADMVEILARLEKGEEFLFETQHRRRDGSTFPVEVRLRPFRRNGQLHTMALVSDISQRKQAEAALERQRQLQIASQQLAGMGYFEMNLRTGELIWSEQLFQIYGLDQANFKPTIEGFFSRLHPEDHESVQRAVETAIRESSGFRTQERIVRPDGEVRVLESHGKVECDADGSPTYLIGACLDITRRHRLEEQLRESQKMEAIGRLAGGVAHDFNNLLTVIQGYTVLLESEPDRETSLEALEAIRHAGDKAAGLTAQLLAFSRRTCVEPKVLDINPLIQRSAGLIRSLLGENIDTRLELAPEPCMLRIDPNQFEQMLMNLVVNARDAMPAGGRLRIQTRCAGDRVEIRVSDSGQGIGAEIMSNIFEPFFTTKETGMGTGLGLAVVHGVVTRWDGAIQVESPPGQGTTFDIQFPCADGQPTPAPQVDCLHTLEGKETLLLVEDEAAVRGVVRRALEGYGYTVVAVALAREALDIDPQAIDLLISDVIMPGMGGVELAGLLRQRRADLPILFVSGYTDNRSELEDLVPGLEAYLQKPFTPAILTAAVRKLLDSAPRRA